MFNKKEVVEIIKNNESVYFTSEQGKVASDNAFSSLKNTTNLKNQIVKDLGIYDGEDFEYDEYEIYDGDSIYILVEA